MSFWDDVSRFAGNLTGGFLGESDEERKKKAREAAAAKAASKGTLDVKSAVDNSGTLSVGSANTSNDELKMGKVKPQEVTVEDPKLQLDEYTRWNVEQFDKMDVDKQRKTIETEEADLRKYKGGNTIEDAQMQYKISKNLDALNKYGKKKDGNLLTFGGDILRGMGEGLRTTGEGLGEGLAAMTGENLKAAEAKNSYADLLTTTAINQKKAGKISQEQYANDIAMADQERFLASRMIDRDIEAADPMKMAGHVASAIATPVAYADGAGTASTAAAGGLLKSTSTQLVSKLFPALSPRLATTAGAIVENILFSAPQAATSVLEAKGGDATFEDYAGAQLQSAVSSAALPAFASVAGTLVSKGVNTITHQTSTAAIKAMIRKTESELGRKLGDDELKIVTAKAKEVVDQTNKVNPVEQLDTSKGDVGDSFKFDTDPNTGALTTTKVDNSPVARATQAAVDKNNSITKSYRSYSDKLMEQYDEVVDRNPRFAAKIKKRADTYYKYAKGYEDTAKALESGEPNKAYVIDKNGKVTESPVSNILQAFKNSTGEDIPATVLGNTPENKSRVVVRRGNVGSYNEKTKIINYRDKTAVFHESVHHVDMFIMDYDGVNPKVLKLQELRRSITPEDIASLRKINNAVDNDLEYVTYAMEELLNGRIEAKTLGQSILAYFKEFFGNIKAGFIDNPRIPKDFKYNDYIKQLDRAIHEVDIAAKTDPGIKVQDAPTKADITTDAPVTTDGVVDNPLPADAQRTPVDVNDVKARLEELRGGSNRQGAPVNTSNPETMAIEARQKLNAEIAKIPDADFIQQMAKRFNLDPIAVEQLMRKTNKADLFNKLNDNAKYIMNADNPAAAAHALINRAKAEGQSAAMRGGVASGTGTILDSRGNVVDTATGEIMESKPGRLGQTPDTPQNRPMPRDFVEDGQGNIVNSRTGEIVEPSNAPIERAPGDTSDLADELAYNNNTTVDDGPPPTPDKTVAGEFSDELSAAYRQEQKLWDGIDAQLKKSGYDPEDVRRKIATANRGEYQPTNSDLQAFRIIQDELDSARAVLEGSGVSFEGNQKYYRPEQEAGSVKTSPAEYSREDLLDFGYDKHRTNALGVDEIDYTANPEIDYTLKARNRDLVLRNSIARAAETDGRAITREGVETAADRTIEMQNTIRDHAARSGAVLRHDTITSLNDIGRAEGYEQVTNTSRSGWATQEPRAILEHAGVYDSGFRQYVNSEGYANELVRIAEANGSSVTDNVRASLDKLFPNADKSSMDDIYNWVIRKIENTEDLSNEQMISLLTSGYRKASKAELTRLGKTTMFTNNKVRKVVNEQMNNILVHDAYSRNFGEKLDSFLSHRINESLRGANILSASFEASDFFNILSDFGGDNLSKSKFGFGKIDGDTFGMSQRYGKAHQRFLSEDIPQEAGKLDEIWGNTKTNTRQKMVESMRNIRDKSLIFSYVERWKTELFLRQADTFYKAKGYSGKALVDIVNDHFEKTMLPSTALTVNRLMGKLPRSLTQYSSWAINSTKRLGRTLAGTNDYGVYADMGRADRIARGIGVEIIPKAATAMVLGVPITQIMGGRDWTGVSSGDYSGIPKEEQNTTDEIVNLLAISPVLGMMKNYYTAYRVDQEKQERVAEQGGDVEKAKSNWIASATGKNATMLVPYYSQAKKVADVIQGQSKGYYENSEGRVQTEALSTPEAIQGAIFGKNYTPTFRDYNDSPDALSVARGKASPIDLVTHNETVDNVSQSVGNKTVRDYTRPLSATTEYDDGSIVKGYSDLSKEAYAAAENKYGRNSKEAKDVMNKWLEDGRAYNKLYDNLSKNDPGALEQWVKTKDGDTLTPEKWQVYAGNDAIYKYEKARKLREQNDLGRKIDPIYNQTDERAKQIMQQRAAYTGDDTELATIMYQSEWYPAFKAEEKAYYDSFEGKKDTAGKSQRYKDWTALSESLYDPAKGIGAKYGLVTANTALYDKYDKNTPEGKQAIKDWYAVNGDAYTAQKAEYDKEKFGIVNQMRKLEGTTPLTWEEYMSKVTPYDANKKSSYGSGGGGGSDLTVGQHGASKSTGITFKGGAKGKLVDVSKAVKKSKRASGKSPIRIKV